MGRAGQRVREVSPFIIGIVVGLLVAGGAVPWIVDRDDSTEVTAAAGAGDSPSLASATDTTALENASGTNRGSPGADVIIGPGAGTGRTTRAAGSGAKAAVGGVTGGGAVPGLRASDVGVTPTEIRVGVLLLDLAAVGAVGFGQGTDGLDPKEQQRWYQAFFNEINATGGINGRTLKPVYQTYDPVDSDSQRAACLGHTQDHDVFAAMENTGGYRGPNVLCYTEEHGTPFISAPHRHNLDITRRSGTNLPAYGMTVARSLASAVHELNAMGQLAGKRIGVIENVRPGDERTTDVGLVTTLRQLGHDVVKRYAFSDNLSTAASQVPVAVQEMRSATVNMIFVNANVLTSTQFVQTADSQVYVPKYVTVDHYGVGSDFGAMNMPNSFAGSFGFTSERDAEHNDPRRPEREPDRRCRETLEKATGEKFGHDTNSSALIRLSCGVVYLLANGLRGAGTNPTRASFSLALQQLGRVDPPRMAPGVFAPGRLDAATHIRAQTWDGGCRCWMILNEFHEAKV